MSNISDFIIENGVLKKYVGPGGDVLIPEGVTSICEGAFARCASLTSIVLPDGITEIGYQAFFGCRRLTSVTVPKSMKQIASYAFYHCSNLKSLKIFGAAIERPNPFLGWNFVDYDADVTAFVVGALEPSTEEALSHAKGIKCIVAPDAPITTISAKKKAALSYLDNPDSYTGDVAQSYRKYIAGQAKWALPEIFKQDKAELLEIFVDHKRIKAENIDDMYLEPAMAAKAKQCVAFLLNWKGTNVTEEMQDKILERELTKDPYNVEDMEKLWNYTKLHDGTLRLTKYKGTDTNVVIPERIGKNMVSSLDDLFSPKTSSGEKKKNAAFLNTIRSVTIPDTITDLSAHTFRGCQGLADQDGFIIIRNILLDYIGSAAEIKVPHGTIAIANAFSKFFKQNKTLRKIELPETVVELRYNAFYNCIRLNHVILQKGLERIGEGAFSLCRSLTSIVLPDGVTDIGFGAFNFCTSLTSIVIPKSVTTIGDRAFSNCDMLTIHAPVGSYAETYAKENNIPFVAE